MTSVGTCTLGNARSSQSGRGTVRPGGGTITFAARYQLSIALNAPGCDQSAMILLLLGCVDLRQVDVLAKGPIEEPVIANLFDQLLESRALGTR